MAGIRGVIYVRNSSGAQVAAGTHEGLLTSSRETAARLGAEVVGVYLDAGRSAKSGRLAHRGDFARLVADLPTLKPDVCIVANVDRLTRTELFRELGAIWGPLQEHGVRVATAGGQILDLSTPDGQLLAMFESWRAARENAARGLRSKTGRARAVEGGGPPCGPPMGLAWDRRRRSWGEAEAAPIIREIFERIAGGATCVEVAEDLHGRGVSTARKGRWTAAQISRVVRNPVYDSGRWVANLGRSIAVPALVSAELAEAARARLDAHQLRGLRRTKHVYLLDGLARCELCGSAMMVHTTVREKGGRVYRYGYYTCERVRFAGRRGPCALPRRHTEEVDGRVWARVEAFLAAPELVLEAMAGPGGEDLADAQAALRAAEEARRALAALPLEEGKVLERERRRLLSPAATEAALRHLKKVREQHERDLALAEQQARKVAAGAASALELREVLAALRAGAEDDTPEERRALVRALVAGATIGPEVVRLDLAVWLGAESGTPDAQRGQNEKTLRVALLA
jgi:DNA invertase Pin-like site-specific DNA recombinase